MLVSSEYTIWMVTVLIPLCFNTKSETFIITLAVHNVVLDLWTVTTFIRTTDCKY